MMMQKQIAEPSGNFVLQENQEAYKSVHSRYMACQSDCGILSFELT